MQMLYNSDNFTVVHIEVPADGAVAAREGFEIVDKRARLESYIDGALAASFRQGVQALVDGEGDVEALDDYIAGFTVLAQQPLNLH